MSAYGLGAVALYVLYEVLPTSFTDEERALFTPVKQGKKTVYYYSFGDVTPKELPDVEVSKRAIVEKEGEPQPISVKDLAQMMRSKRVVFFTGAGISASAGIHTMTALYDDLGLNSSVEIDDFVRNAMHHPEVLVQKVLAFYRSTKMSPPTPAHLSLAHLSNEKQSQILTGNFDLLHERSGVIPYRVFYRDMEKDLSPESLKEVDVILCIGMSQDIRGVLKRYKEANPDGILVSINKEAPDFLGEKDYVVLGDVQELLPAVEKEFNSITETDDTVGRNLPNDGW